MKRKALRAAFPHTLPVLTGYAFLGLAYGILMQSAGFPFWYPALISLVVYAGSMQYAAVPLLGAAFDRSTRTAAFSVILPQAVPAEAKAAPARR